MKTEKIVKSAITKAVKEALTEGINPSSVVVVQGKEVPFGDKIHQQELAATLDCLERLRNCYPKGSAARQTYSHACTRLRKLLGVLAPKIETELAE